VVALAAVLGGGTAFTLGLQEQIRQTEKARKDADDKAADDLVEKVKAIKQKKMENPQPTS